MAEFIRDSYWTEEIKSWQTKQLTCVRCGLFFTEANNIGSLACWQHPYFPPASPGEYWPCCGRKCIRGKTAAQTGCVRADHTTLLVPFDEKHNIPIPKVFVETVLKRKFSPNVIVKPDSLANTEEYDNQEERDEADSYITVRRYELS